MKDGLVKTANRLAWLTIGYNMIEGLVSVAFGLQDDSLSLFGFGLDSFVEVFSATAVLWRLRRGSGGSGSLERERLATRAIGLLFIALSAVVLAGSALRLHGRVHPDTALPGVIISLASLSFMFWLYRSKMRIARALDSRSLKSDALCSLACIWLSAVLLAGSGLHYLSRVWWADSLAAAVIAILVLREGAGLVRASLDPGFDGCCSCGGSRCKSHDPQSISADSAVKGD